jgi:hypothetical protein
MTYLAVLYHAIKGDGIALDEAECEALGGPDGQTISMWTAMEARHGSALAHVFCLALWVVQRHHCRDQLAGVPMEGQNYIRAVIALVAFAPIVGIVWLARQIVRGIQGITP